MDNHEALREFYKKYHDGVTDEELQKNWKLVQENCFFSSDQSLTVGVNNLREDFDRAVKCNSVTNAEQILEWFKTHPYLPKPSLGFIHKFLWASKEDMEKCKKKLLRYYTLRGTDDELFGNRDPCSSDAKQVHQIAYITCLSNLTPELYRVNFSALRDSNPDLFNAKDWLRHILYIADLRIKNDFSLGDVIIYDLKGFTMQHLLKFPVTLAKKMVIATEGALPTKIKQIHMINAPTFVDKLVALFKPFLKEKITKRIFVHSDGFEELLKYVPKEILPNEYGGTAGPISELCDVWIKEIEKNRDWFKNEENNIKRLYSEAKKEGKLFVDTGELFGVEGSFKKLSID